MDFKNQNFAVFEVVVHNLGRCDNDMIKLKNNDFHYMHTYMVSSPTSAKNLECYLPNMNLDSHVFLDNFR